MVNLPTPLIILLAFVLDLLFADPQVRWHPVRVIGQVAEFFCRFFYSLGRLGGLLTLLFTSIVFVGGVSFTVCLFPPLEILWLYFFIAPTSLQKEVLKVAEALQENISLARKRLSFLVGRETKNLDTSQCVRAAVETLAENFTDALVGPLFWYMVGGIYGVAFYKVCETLDSMYGYKTKKWLRFGYFSAKFDDILNFLPARLAGLFIVLASGLTGQNLWRAFRTMLADAHKHDSPNSGYTEAAMAGALGIELGGPVVYQGQFFEKERFGKPLREREVSDIFLAGKIIRLATFLIVATIVFLEVFLWKLGYPNLIELIMNELKGALIT
ncbi:cobalamin biosynthesis protein CobD [Thermodesulfatator indicus DSM 15286]|uniref:Cobalamin biosynthesis protein CobD n=1 Tax=Thermodesulfatator indicus (strain DSM 15286 / JCM 11887 / CIR29812) TaxID=667014 RepID=F8ABZ7_THEID|nr:adenosylcobinamide-phosphate synthase CbiB [Thermodesulfatator indicus]AEH45695.1 cobalamin biosynthesis protein CobD [Thermodesulfatator indicus DSM 15286]